MGELTVCFLLCPALVLEKIRSAVGSAQLLMSQKVQQFYRLCQQNMVSARPPSWGRLRLSLVGWGAAEPMLCGMTWPLLSPQDPNAFPVPTFQDLAGFWDLLQLSIEDVSMKFAELQQLKANGWKIIEPKVRAGGHGAGAGAHPSLLLHPTHLWPNRCCRRQKAPAGAFSNHLKNKEQEKKRGHSSLQRCCSRILGSAACKGLGTIPRTCTLQVRSPVEM